MSELLRNSVNLVVFGVLTVGLLVYAGLEWARDVVWDDRYPVTVALPETGGLVEDHHVTVLGHQVGWVGDIDMTTAGVELELLIDPEGTVPRHVVVELTRRSAIGEQTLNLIPVAPDWEAPEHLVPRFVDVAGGWEPAQHGDQLEVMASLTPVSIPTFIENVEELFAAIDHDDLETTIVELAAALGGRGDVLVDLNVQAEQLNETLVAGIPDFERLIASSEPVLRAMSDSRREIARSITHIADLSELLARNRPTLETLTTETGTRALVEGDAFLRENRANLTCLIQDLRDLNEATLLDDGGWFAQTLDYNRYFFGAVDVAFQWDPYRPKHNWVRVADLLFSGDAGGGTYAERVPTPATRPGAACTTPFGVGANAVRQADHQPPDPTSPGIDWAPLVEEDQDDRDRAPAAARPTTPLPATGGGGAGALLGPLLALYLVVLSRRRRTGP